MTLRRSSTGTLPPPVDAGIQTSLTGLGFRVNRDTRPNRFYPTAGTLFDFSSTFFAQGLGSKYSFQSYKFTFNYYRSLSSKRAARVGVIGEDLRQVARLYGECIYGPNNELRGYVAF
jgi:outer membrane protein assembly factor BamA